MDYGIIHVMKSLAELDQLNLDAHTHKQVAGLIQTLLAQSQQEISYQQL